MAEHVTRFDLVIVGSGGGGLTAAITAKSLGLEPLVLEKTDKVGGTTALSGGLAWIANNPLMREAGAHDSPEDALRYLDELVGDADPPSLRAKREAYVREGSEMIAFLRTQGIPFHHMWYPDYYSELPGANEHGRPLETLPFDTRELGAWRTRLRPQALIPRRLKIRTSEFTSVSLARRNAHGFLTLLKIGLRSGVAMLRGSTLAVAGEALAGRLLRRCLALGIEIWTDSPMLRLQVEDGRIVGVVALHDGVEVAIAAPRGVLLSAGGYARSQELRDRWARQPSSAAWTNANPGETGDGLRAAIEIGARTAHLEEAWYSPMSTLPNGTMIPHNMERSKPHSIIVDQSGERYVNESMNYNAIGHAMYERNRSTPAIPSWLIVDANHRRKYPFFVAPPGRTPSEWLASGYMKKAGSIRELAAACGIDEDALERTVARFNELVRAGHDDDFGRGDARYDHYFGDPRNRPNPSLGAVDRPPFYAVSVVPGDIGTCGGLVTDEHARVLGEGDAPIAGLYATGNITSPIGAGKYWGAGASIGSSMTFGYVAARHAADAAAAHHRDPREAAIHP